MSVDFSRIANVYDDTRRIPSDVLERALDVILSELPAGSRRLLDVGCGTGQIALAFAARDLRVVGVDLSEAMVAVARERAAGLENAEFQVADAHKLPFADPSFDVVVASKLFEHVTEPSDVVLGIVRTLTPAGVFIHIRDRGGFRNVVRRRLEEIADESGYARRYAGLSDLDQLQQLFGRLGWGFRLLGGDLAWEKTLTAADAFAQLQERLFAEFWPIPQDEYDRMLDELARWIEAEVGWGQTESMHVRLHLELFSAAA